MRPPLDNWSTLKRGSVPFGKAYPRTPFMGRLGGSLHRGTDVMCPVGTPIYAMTDGLCTKQIGKEVGNSINFTTETNLFRLMHLSKYNAPLVKNSAGKMVQVNSWQVKEGDLIGWTGMTGKTSAPHLHIDISKSTVLKLSDIKAFLDPEVFFCPVV